MKILIPKNTELPTCLEDYIIETINRSMVFIAIQNSPDNTISVHSSTTTPREITEKIENKLREYYENRINKQ